MTRSIKRVAVAGPNGNTGPTVVKTLSASGFDVTALTRSLPYTRKMLGPNVEIVEVDYLSHESLVSALAGIDAVVVCGVGMVPEQINLIDAAIAVGVPRFFPASFDGDLADPIRRAMQSNIKKVIALEHLKAHEAVISHTSIRTGPLLDFVLARGALIDMKDHSIRLFDDGEKKFSTTTTETASRAIAAALKMGKEAENREFWIHDLVTNQNELFKWAKEVTPHADWTVIPANSEEMAKRAEEAKKVDPNSRMLDVMQKTLAVFGKEFNSAFGAVDNEELGIGLMNENQVKALLSTFVGAARDDQSNRDAAVITHISSSVKVD